MSSSREITIPDGSVSSPSGTTTGANALFLTQSTLGQATEATSPSSIAIVQQLVRHGRQLDGKERDEGRRAREVSQARPSFLKK